MGAIQLRHMMFRFLLFDLGDSQARTAIAPLGIPANGSTPLQVKGVFSGLRHVIEVTDNSLLTATSERTPVRGAD